jgi:nitrate reductase (cytochrome), electron transfer subunit
MKSKELIFLVAFVIVLGSAILTSKMTTPDKESAKVTSAAKTALVITQLQEEGRESSSTMVLQGAPPMQPASHIDRWNPDLHHESCMACHANPSTGAPTPPKNHFYEDNVKNKVFRDNCIQCHAQQNDSKSAFNEE